MPLKTSVFGSMQTLSYNDCNDNGGGGDGGNNDQNMVMMGLMVMISNKNVRSELVGVFAFLFVTQ